MTCQRVQEKPLRTGATGLPRGVAAAPRAKFSYQYQLVDPPPFAVTEVASMSAGPQ
jgi:hypothetical protein